MADLTTTAVTPEDGPDRRTGDPYLHFELTLPGRFALPAVGVQEVQLVQPEQLTPFPNVSPLVLGAINWRGRLVWVVDLGRFLGAADPLPPGRQELPVLVLAEPEGALGLAVTRLGNMLWIPVEALRRDVERVPRLASLLRGFVMPSDRDPRGLLVLDPQALLAPACWAA